ncbi:MAG: hypothetical protein I8H75_01905 [Myxococcaceae bacterium]|nr:hypothetical protein [Myxococcaceae bacterium]MBH2006091.1 hypothetical protein [Myxococcaceae bacterium]
MKNVMIRKLLKSVSLICFALLETVAFAEKNSSKERFRDAVQCGEATCCGGAWLNVCADASPLDSEMFTLTIKSNSNADCDSQAPQNWQQPTMYGQAYNDLVIYHVDQIGCGGNNWDIGAKVLLSGGACEAGYCFYDVTLISSHNGVGGQCQCNNVSSFMFNVPKP